MSTNVIREMPKPKKARDRGKLRPMELVGEGPAVETLKKNSDIPDLGNWICVG
jgi:hypothetical protein